MTKEDKLVNALHQNIFEYEAKSKIERRKMIITISENNIKILVATYFTMYGIAPSDYRSVTFAGATLMQSEMLKDNEIVIGVKKII